MRVCSKAIQGKSYHWVIPRQSKVRILSKAAAVGPKVWEEAMSVTAKLFQKIAKKLPEKVTDMKAKEHHVWAVPIPFSAISYIECARYASETAYLLKERRNNAEFYQTHYSKSAVEFEGHR